MDCGPNRRNKAAFSNSSGVLSVDAARVKIHWKHKLSFVTKLSLSENPSRPSRFHNFVLRSHLVEAKKKENEK